MLRSADDEIKSGSICACMKSHDAHEIKHYSRLDAHGMFNFLIRQRAGDISSKTALCSNIAARVLFRIFQRIFLISIYTARTLLRKSIGTIICCSRPCTSNSSRHSTLKSHIKRVGWISAVSSSSCLLMSSVFVCLPFWRELLKIKSFALKVSKVGYLKVLCIQENFLTWNLCDFESRWKIINANVTCFQYNHFKIPKMTFCSVSQDQFNF